MNPYFGNVVNLDMSLLGKWTPALPVGISFPVL